MPRPTKAAGAAKSVAKKAVKKAAPVKKAAAKKAAPAKKKAAAKKAVPVKKAAPPKKAPAKKAAVPTKKSAAPAKKAAAPAKKTAAAPTRSTFSFGTAVPVKKAGAKKASSPYDKKFLDAQREMLLEERATYTRQADSLQADADALVNDYEPGDVQFDEESGEGDTLAVERERDLALSAQARQAVVEIDEALARITNGVYGVCEVSGLPIPKERLRAIPWARERVEYKAAGISRY